MTGRPGSWRSAPLPSNWAAIRRRVFERDGYVCQEILDGDVQCGAPASECDHTGDPGDHSLSALRALCGPCHRHKSAASANEAMRAKRAEIDKRLRKPVEKHPGML